MANIDFASLSPNATVTKTSFLFGADDQASGPPSTYQVSGLLSLLFGSTAFSGDTVTASKPLLDMAQTWNNAAVTFTADKINITKTAANAASLLFDRQVDGVSKAKIDVLGKLTLAGGAIFGTGSQVWNAAGNAGLYFGSGDFRFYTSASSSQYRFNDADKSFTLGSLTVFGWRQQVDAGTSIIDLTLARDNADVLALRNGTNAQAFNVYNTYTDASNYERAGVIWSSNVAYLRTQNAGTGSARLLIYQSGSTTVASLPSAATAGAGARAMVTDASSTTFLSTVSGGGANKVPVVSDGTNWLIG